MILLKERGAYLDSRSGGRGISGSLIRLFSKNARNYKKGLTGEEIIIDALRTLDNTHYLINDITLPDSSGNIDHVLLSPTGIFAIETKHWEGEIICNGNEWIKRLTWRDFNLGSPSLQVKRNALQLSKLIEAQLFNGTYKVWVEGIVVLTNSTAEIRVQKPTVTVLLANELCDHIMQIHPKTIFSSRDLESIGNFIIERSTEYK